MYTYKILQNGYQIGVTKGKFKAFKFIKTLLGDKIGLWFGNKCILKDEQTEYTIERAVND